MFLNNEWIDFVDNETLKQADEVDNFLLLEFNMCVRQYVKKLYQASHKL